MEESQAVLNGQKFLQSRRTAILGISPGNPHYYKMDALKRLFNFAGTNSDKIMLFLPDEISEHSYRAIGSSNPHKSAHVKANRLRNKCREASQGNGFSGASYSFVRWKEEVEACPKYTEAFLEIQDLYEANDEFRADVRESTESALRSLKSRGGKGICERDGKIEESSFNMKEGVKYLLKELAFFVAVPSVYESCEEFVLVYHRSWPVLEKFFDGYYDCVARPSLGFVVFE